MSKQNICELGKVTINMRKCGLCDACLLRKKGFDEANLDDN